MQYLDLKKFIFNKSSVMQLTVRVKVLELVLDYSFLSHYVGLQLYNSKFYCSLKLMTFLIEN